MGIRDTRLLERALTQKWPISEKHQQAVVAILVNILADPEASPREKTAAARALMAANSQNLEIERIEQADEHEHRARLVEIAKHLGFEQMSRLASANGITLAGSDGQPVGEREAASLNGGQASQGTGLGDTESEEPRPTH